MTRTLTFSPRIWSALEAGELTLPVAGATEYRPSGSRDDLRAQVVGALAGYIR